MGVKIVYINSGIKLKLAKFTTFKERGRMSNSRYFL